MASYGPTFCDITWGAGGSTADLTLDIAAKMQNMVGIPALTALPAWRMVPDNDAHAACTIYYACADLGSQHVMETCTWHLDVSSNSAQVLQAPHEPD